jgi:hypothetical protein
MTNDKSAPEGTPDVTEGKIESLEPADPEGVDLETISGGIIAGDHTCTFSAPTAHVTVEKVTVCCSG